MTLEIILWYGKDVLDMLLKTKILGWEYSSMVVHLPSMAKALGLISSTTNIKIKF
jgi:hypothetical protein